MRILMLNNEYPPIGGGTGTVNKEILEGLKNYKDIKIDLITGGQGKENHVEQVSDNVRIFVIGLNRKNIHHASNLELITYTFKAFFKARKMQKSENYDFSFSWSSVPAGFISLVLYYIFKLPYIVRIGGSDIPGSEKRYTYIYKLISPIIKTIWKKSNLLIIKCEMEKEKVFAINSKLKLKIISNGVDTQKYKPVDRSENEQIQLICVARLIKLKGQDLLIKAISQLKNEGIIFQVVLVGDGDETANYKSMAKELHVSHLVDFKGYIERERIEKFYQKADIFVLPSCSEGMSNALLEAMACGLPVIVTNVGGTHELVTEGENGFIFQVGDKDQLSNIIKNIAKEPHILKEMGIKSRVRAEVLNWQNVVNEYYTIFKNFRKT